MILLPSDMALKQELIFLILIHQQFCIFWTHKGYQRSLSQYNLLCACHYSIINVRRSFKVAYQSTLVIMPRNLLFQNNVFMHLYPMLQSSERAKLTNYSIKAISQNFTVLFFSHLQQNLTLLQLTYRSQSKRSYTTATAGDFLDAKMKKRVFFTISMPWR